MTELLIDVSDREVAPVHALRKRDLDAFLERRRASIRAQAGLQDFKATPGQVCLATLGDGEVDRVLFGLGDEERPDPMIFRAAPARLPPGDYRIASAPPGMATLQTAVAWGLGGYGFDRYKAR